MGQKNTNPALDGYVNNLKANIYEHNGNRIDFRTASPKVIEMMAKDPTFKFLSVKPEAPETKSKTDKSK